MKVLYYVPSLTLCNGIATYVMSYYRALREKIDFDFLMTRDANAFYIKEIQDNGDHIYCLPQTKNIKRINQYMLNLLKKGKYDIVHSHVINRGALLLKIAKKCGIKVRILHSHTTKLADSFFKTLIRIPFKNTAIKYANSYFACSKLAGDYLFKKKDYYVINNAIDIKHFSKKTNNVFTFGTIGRFTTQKNPEFILEILKSLKKQGFKYKFIWVGDGVIYDEIKNKAIGMGLRENIIFTGAVSDVISYYEMMDLFVLPSLYEGLPVVGVEAQMYEIPCIFSNTITEEILINENVEMLGIDDPKLWCDRIIEVASSPTRTITNNKARILYDISNNANNIYNIYKNLLNDRRIR